MTNQPTELRIDMVDSDENTIYAKYDRFRLLSARKAYELRFDVHSYSGTAGR